MNHATDAELLDLALLAEDMNPEISQHVSGCSECAHRFEEVRTEQELLCQAFAEVDPPARRQPVAGRRSLFRWAAAAALLAAVGLGAAASHVLSAARLVKVTQSDRRALQVLSVKQLERDLDSLQRKISDTRGALAEPGSEPAARDYVRLLSEGEDRFVELLSSYCDASVPLAEEQKAALKAMLDRFLGRAQIDERKTLEEEFLARLTEVLSGDQHEIVREYLRQEAEVAWTHEIDDLLDDLADALDLRFSEVEPVRGVLTQGFPKSALGAIPGGDPGDILVEEPLLTGRIRGALRSDHHVAFDAYVAHERREREGVRRVMLTFRSR